MNITVATELLRQDLIAEYELVVAKNLERHLAVSHEWDAHNYVPWADGENFNFCGGQDWSENQVSL
ncbi:MAG: acyl-ACP desaturase, partial [Mycobacteriaceae bacterium]